MIAPEVVARSVADEVLSALLEVVSADRADVVTELVAAAAERGLRDARAAWARLVAETGAVVTVADLRAMGDGDRAALADAVRSARAEQAAASGLAAQGPAQAAAILAVSDGGAARRTVALERAAAGVCAALERENAA